MITAILMRTIGMFLILVSGLLPNWRLPSYITDPISQISSLLTILNGIFPIDAIFKCIILVLAFELTLFTGRILFGVMSVIRGGGKIDI